MAALRTVELVAPAGLRVRVEAERDRARTPLRRRRLALGGAFAAGLAAAALALALALPSAGPGAPTVVEAAQLAQLPAARARGDPRLSQAARREGLRSLLSRLGPGPRVGGHRRSPRPARGPGGGDGLLREGRPPDRLHDPRRAADRARRRAPAQPRATETSLRYLSRRQLGGGHLGAQRAHLRALRSRACRATSCSAWPAGRAPPSQPHPGEEPLPGGGGISPIPRGRAAREARGMDFSHPTGTAS